jgi:pyruvate dehydrogenase E2 component (dihydrolipoamide acetyltransferase)
VEEITMPKLSDSMEVGRIIQWRVSEGDEVNEGDILADVESDKANMELECFRSGRVAKILYGDDSEAPVGEVIAIIAEEGEDIEEAAPAEEEQPEAEEAAEEKPAEEPEEEQAREKAEAEKKKEEEKKAAAAEEEGKPAPQKPPAPARKEGERIAISPYARKLAEQEGIDYAQIQGSGPDGRIIARDIEAAAKGEAPHKEETPAPEAEEEKPPAQSESEAALKETKAEPMARTLAKQHGIEIASLTGTGLGGRITVDDVLAARKGKPEPVSPPADEELPPLEIAEGEAEVEDAPFRLKTQARIVTASKHVIPHFYITRGADVTDLMKRRGELKETLGASVTHLVMLAVIKAIEKNPVVNRSYDHGRVIRWNGIHLGLAVDTDQGLTVVVLRDAQDLSLRDIVEQSTVLIEKARTGKLSAEERRHPTCTITNLGMYDVEHFQPIVNPPSSITLAVSSALEQPVVRDGGIAVGRVMRLTTSCDHRIIEGVHAAAFLADLRALLEDPDTLLSGEDAAS